MSKHIIGYGILIAAVAVLAGQVVNSPEPQKQVKTETAPPKIVAPADYKQNQKELVSLKEQLTKKDAQIAKLRESIDSKTAEIKKVEENAAKGIVKSDVKKKKNDIASLLDSVSGMMDNEQMRKSQKKFMARRYVGLFKRLNLSEEDQDKLMDLMMERNKQKQQNMSALFRGSGDGKAITLDAEAIKEAQAETEADKEIADMLGDDYDKFDKYEKTAWERRQLKDINNSLNDTDALSMEQEDSLVDIMAERNKDKRSGNAKDDEEYVSQASEFLNESQTEEVRKSFKRNKGGLGGFGGVIPGGNGSNVQIMTFP